MSQLRLILPAFLFAAPLAAQNPSRHALQGSDVALYDLAGTVQIEPASGNAVSVEVARGGADPAKIEVAEGQLEGSSTLRVVFPGDRIKYPPMREGWTEIRVRDDGTFGSHVHQHDHEHARHHDDDDADDDDASGRRVVISSRDGLEAWADLKIGVPTGRRVAVHLAVGKITATNVNGRLELETSNGPVVVNGSKGELEVEVGSGNVQLSATEGDLEVTTGSGDVQATRSNARSISIQTGSGDVEARQLQATEVAVRTGSGAIRASGVTAPQIGLETGSGGVTVELHGTVDRLDVHTGSGDIAVTAPASLGAQIDMQTASGDLDSDFPLSVTHSGADHLRGTVGDGKGRISVETGSGGVRLLKAR
jgi:lia operon protein LiaG